MRKLFIVVALFGLLWTAKGHCLRIGPYFYLYTAESAFIPDTGGFSLSTSIYADFAAKIILDERWSLMPFYQLNYQGPGATAESKEGANFQEQYQNHSLLLKASYLLGENWLLGARIGYFLQLSKTGSTETWEKGLYNYQGLNLGIEGGTKIIRNIELDLGYLLQQNIYPNYSNLIGYVEKTEARPEQDHYRNEIYAKAGIPLVKNLSLNLGLNETVKAYTAQGVIQESGEEDTSTKQVDNLIGLDIGLNYLPLQGLELGLGQKLEINNSNQNNLSFISITDTNTRFISGYYNYVFYQVSPKVTLTFPNGISCNFTYLYNIKNYTKRPARDSEGNWLDALEYDITATIDTGFSFPMGKYSLGIYYTYISAVSNMQYEQYYRYNYHAHNLRLTYSFEI